MTTERLTDEAMLPCPFCGGKANTQMLSHAMMIAYCEECHAQTPLCYGLRSEAVAAWNRRATPADDLRAADDAVQFLYKHGDLTHSAAHAAIRMGIHAARLIDATGSAGLERYHHDAVVRELVEALEGLLHHEIAHVGPHAGARVIAARAVLAKIAQEGQA